LIKSWRKRRRGDTGHDDRWNPASSLELSCVGYDTLIDEAVVEN
jgi:hypothetical protein